MKVRVATAQFAVSRHPEQNAGAIIKTLDESAAAGARVLHFCEGALSGYAPHDLENWRDYDWRALGTQARRVAEAAAARGIWVILGSAHPLCLDGSGPRPHNSVYVIDDKGALIDRYDKRFCAGGENEGELALYSPGDHRCVFEIDGVRCGVMICHEYRYPELYRDYKRQGVDLLFHSFHAANNSDELMSELEAQVGAEHHDYNWGRTLPEITMPATLVATAAANHMWMSGANSSAPRSCWSSFFVRPDGVIVDRLDRDQPGVLINDVDTKAPLYESTRHWRDRAIAGTLYSGTPADAARSRDRRRF